MYTSWEIMVYETLQAAFKISCMNSAETVSTFTVLDIPMQNIELALYINRKETYKILSLVFFFCILICVVDEPHQRVKQYTSESESLTYYYSLRYSYSYTLYIFLFLFLLVKKKSQKL